MGVPPGFARPPLNDHFGHFLSKWLCFRYLVSKNGSFWPVARRSRADTTNSTQLEGSEEADEHQMSLKVKTLVIVGITLIGLLATVFFASEAVSEKAFGKLEEQSIDLDVKRAINNLSDVIGQLNGHTIDYAAWDQTYAFMGGADQGFPVRELDY